MLNVLYLTLQSPTRLVSFSRRSAGMISCLYQRISWYKLNPNPNPNPNADLALKGKKAIVSILSSLNTYGTLSKTVFFKLFDVKIAPILFYGAELWGTKMYDSLEYVHRYACKRFLNVNFKVCNSFALGDCGRFPLHIQTQKRVEVF